jgi:hypothetical protein
MRKYRSFLNMFNHLKASRDLHPKTGSWLPGGLRALISAVALLALGAMGHGENDSVG